MNVAILSLLVLSQVPTGHGPPVVRGQPPPPQQMVFEESRSGVHIYTLRPNAGIPMLQVVGAEGAQVQVWLGPQRMASSALPLSLKVVPEMFYTVQVQLTPELSFQKKVQVHAGTMGTLEVWRPVECVQQPPQEEPRPHHDGHHGNGQQPQWGPPPPEPPRPVAMDDARMAALVRAIKAESYEDRKLAVVKQAMQSNFFYTGQVGHLVDLFDFGDGRVGVIRAARGRLVDPENAFVIYEHFRFDSEKEQARRLLEE